MTKWQRMGLWIMLTTLAMAVVFAGDPTITEGHWKILNIVTLIMSGVGGVLFVSN